LEKPKHVAPPLTGNESPLTAPHGLNEIIATFGDIQTYVASNGQLLARWQVDFLARASLPFPLHLSWDPSRTVTQMTCHRRMTDVFSSVFGSIQERGLQDGITSYGGCFAFRPQRTGSKLSTHSWGIAIDLNPESNPQGSAGNMDSGVINIFRHAGFEWGGDWQGKTRDPMHFQFCTGY
jgi:hypothetical protein